MYLTDSLSWTKDEDMLCLHSGCWMVSALSLGEVSCGHGILNSLLLALNALWPRPFPCGLGVAAPGRAQQQKQEGGT